MACELVRRALLTQNGVRARTPLNSGWFRLIFYGHTSLSGHKVGMLSPKKDQLKPLGRFNSKLYTKSSYIGVRARTPCTFWDNYQFCQNCVFCVNKLWIKWKWTLYDQYTLKGHELNLYCIKKLPAYELVRRALLSRAILTCIQGGVGVVSWFMPEENILFFPGTFPLIS